MAGGISGWVKNEAGVPQMGALVVLLTPEGRVTQRAYTDASGRFALDQIFPGEYAVKVSLAQFLPLLREGVAVEAGQRTYLDVQLSGLFASLQLVFPARGEIRDMTDDWKWVLRAVGIDAARLALPGRSGAGARERSAQGVGHLQRYARFRAGQRRSGLAAFRAGQRVRPGHGIRGRHLAVWQQRPGGQRQPGLRPLAVELRHRVPHHL